MFSYVIDLHLMYTMQPHVTINCPLLCPHLTNTAYPRIIYTRYK